MLCYGYTALDNGAVSAAISFLRTLLFQVGAVFILPVLFGITGIWMAIVAAELLAFIVKRLPAQEAFHQD